MKSSFGVEALNCEKRGCVSDKHLTNTLVKLSQVISSYTCTCTCTCASEIIYSAYSFITFSVLSNQGVSRSGAICVAYLMRTKKMNFRDALAYLKLSKPDVCRFSFFKDEKS